MSWVDAHFARLPMVETEQVNTCNACGTQDEYTEIARGHDYELETCGNTWHFVTCNRCAHVWLNPRPALAALPQIYPPHYYSYAFSTQLNPIAVRGKAWMDASKLRGILKNLGRKPKSYLDVGCGDGRFLRSMRAAGLSDADISGLELDTEVAQKLRQEGFNVHAERIEDCQQFDAGSIDLITMFHVIEHVDDPAKVIQQLSHWLAPGGLLALETPNLESMDARLFARQFWGGYHIPRHWHLFRPASLRDLLEQAGLEVVDLRYQPGHSFWMYSWHHRLKYGKRSWPRLARWFDPFNSLMVLIATTTFDKLRAMFGAKTSAMLLIARRRPVSTQ